MSSAKDKLKAIESAVGAIEKQFGKGSLMRLGADGAKAEPIDVIPTGCFSLDLALGVGGIPRGRIVEIYGPESSGKTTLTLHLVSEAQKKGGVAAFVDAEHALDTHYAANIGVNLEEVLVSQPDSGEQALEIVDTLVNTKEVDLIVVDSVAALTPRAEIEGNMGDTHVGLQARLMSQALRKLTSSVAKSNCTVIFINQIRMKIGVMFGNPETTTGGNALKFYSSVRLDIRRIASIKQSDSVIGNRCRVKVVKNKVGAPFQESEFDIIFGKGISKIGDMLDLAVKEDIVAKGGSWFSYKDSRLGQGRENVKEFLEQNPDILSQIELDLKRHYNLLPGSSGAGDAEAAETKATDAKAAEKTAHKATEAPAKKSPGRPRKKAP